jgi:ferric-dicitrate binding protein FerR (iron transport regulator)
VIAAQHAHVGSAAAEVGTTIYGGDYLSTEQQGNVQLRAGAARLMLLGSSSVTVDDAQGARSARLLSGTATFSTGNTQAFTLYASKAAVRPQTDAPTIGQVTYLSDKELIVRSTRGGLAVTVDGETQIIPDGTSYRVVLDPDMAQGPEGAGSGQNRQDRGGPPLRAGRSRFLIIAITAAAAITAFAIYKAWESPDRP